VVVRARLLEDGTDACRMRISIEDTGIGIPAHAQQKIFEQFSQLDGSTTRQYGGTGLGLAICRRLVELMHGTIGVDSAPGAGARFHIDLCLPRGSSTPEAVRAGVELAGVRALVVDDNATNREILMRQLQGWGMQVECASDGPAALALLARRRANGGGFDIAVLDMHMPHMDGLKLATVIRSDPALAGLRLVVLTSSYASASVRERERAGILRCVHKPIRQTELREVLGSALRCAPGETSAVPAETSAEAKLGGHVLLAEDNPVNQQVGQAMLRKLGLSVRFADNGRQALKLATSEAFDLILMDCHMPVMDGYEASVAIRALNRTPRVPIVALTANVMEGNRERCLAAGMDDFLAKPYSLAQLEATLQRWMSAASAPTGAATAVATPPVKAATETQAPPAIDHGVIAQFRELDPDGGSALAARILDIYAESSGGVFAELEQSMSAGDGERLRRAAHSLKSSSGNVGARQLAALFKEFELLGKENRLDEAHAQLDALRAEYARALDSIRALRLEFET